MTLTIEKEAANPRHVIKILHALSLSSIVIESVSCPPGQIVVQYSGESEVEIDQIMDTLTAYVPSTEIKNVTPRQMRVAMIQTGISLASIDAFIDSLSEPDRSIVKVTWDYSVEVQRDNPLLVAMATQMGMTTQQVDDLFLLAATL